MDLTIIVEQLSQWAECPMGIVEQARKHIPPEGMRARDVLGLPIPLSTRIDLVVGSGVLPDSEARLFACRTCRRALRLVEDPDPRSMDSVSAAERFAQGHLPAADLQARLARGLDALDGLTDVAREVASAAAWACEADARMAAFLVSAHARMAHKCDWRRNGHIEALDQIADLLAVIDRLEATCEP